MRLQDLNWMDVEEYLQHDNRIILITGATEQHAYLSLMTDILIPSRIAEGVAKRENVLIAPPLNFGISYYFGEYPGTISLSRSTFEYVVLEIVESLLHQGFRRFFILNGHGGNEKPERLADFEMAGEIQVIWYEWFRGHAAAAFAERHNLHIDHANWGENFPFTRVADVPKIEKPPINPNAMGAWYYDRNLLGDGSFGGQYQVDDELMYMLFDEIVDEATSLVKSLVEHE